MSDADQHDPIAERVAALAAMLKEYERAANGYPMKPRDPAKDPAAFVVMSVKAR